MKRFRWDSEKNKKLIAERGISFEMVVYYLQTGHLVDDVKHPNQDKYAHQNVLVLDFNDYIYLVPYVESEQEIFLKTIIPSRKATKKYLGGVS